MAVLLHCCCAPCAVNCIDTLRQEGISPEAFWYNPNIHPYTEYKARRDTLISYAPTIDLPLIVVENYGLRNFVREVVDDIDHRCSYCYEVRMEETARYAAEHGYEAFTTSLLISPYQKHDQIRETCERMADKYRIPFLYRDFRPYFREGQEKARALGFYMQKYCGCIFSEEDRYQKQIKKDLTRNGEKND